MTIVQPRAFHEEGAIRSRVITAKSLHKWGEHRLIPAVKATQDPKAPFTPSERACLWCPVSGMCAANGKKVLSTAELDFEDLVGDEGPEFSIPGTMTTEQILYVIEHKKQFEGWLKSVYNFAHESALLGFEYTDKKLVETWTNRKFPYPKKAQRAFTKAKLPVAAMFGDTKLKTPKQIEDYLKTVMRWEPERIDKLMKKHVIREISGTALVSIDDRRIAIRSPAVSDFDGH